jgi:uncharacterized repeat protein (TIGR02543 family)
MDEYGQIAKQTVLYGADISVIDDPEKAGYTFTGWYSDSELTEPYVFPETMPYNDITVYAKYDLNQYTVTFLNEDGTPLQSSGFNYGETPSYS